MELMQNNQVVLKKERTSTLELLRIISMLFIVWCHVCVEGFRDSIQVSSSFSSLFIYGFCFSGELGNTIFGLISGYFLSDTNFSIKKVKKIWGQVFFYSAVFGLFFYFTKLPCVNSGTLGGYGELADILLIPCGKKNLLFSLFPVLSVQYWYISGYIVFYFFLPALNLLTANLEKKDFKKLVIISVILTNIIPMFSFLFDFSVINGGRILLFFTWYFVATYIKKYDPKILQTCWKDLLFAFVLIFLLILYRVLFLLFCAKGIINSGFIVNHVWGLTGYFYRPDSLPILVIGVLLLSGFKNLKIKNSKIINVIAGTTLGVYLIHINPLFSQYMWNSLIHVENFKTSSLLPLWMLLFCSLIFICCVAVELIRQKLFKVLRIS